MDVIPAIDVEAGRSRVVYWPGASAGVGAPTDRPDRIAEQFVAQGARILHLVDFDGAQRAAPANLEAVGRGRGAGSRCRSSSRVASRSPTTCASRSPRARRGSCSRSRSSSARTRCAGCLAVAGDWLAVGLDPRPERIAAFPWRRGSPPTLDALVEELVARGVRRLVLSHGGGVARRRR